MAERSIPLTLDFPVVLGHQQQRRSAQETYRNRSLETDTILGGGRDLHNEDGEAEEQNGAEADEEETGLSLGNHHEISSQDPIRELLDELRYTLAQFGNPLSSSSHSEGSSSDGKWARGLTLECAKAVSSKDMVRVQHLLWVLNELASPYGDSEQRLAYHFLQAVFCRMTGTGVRTLGFLRTAMESSCSFESLRETILKFQNASPWTTFGHVAANGAILEALEGEATAHILDFSNTFCTQWPTLLEALATRQEGAPHLRLTNIVVSRDQSAIKAMREVSCRMEKFARLMGVPFEFTIKQSQEDLHALQLSQSNASASAMAARLLDLHPGEALAVNFNQSLRHIPIKSPLRHANSGTSPRDALLCAIRNMKPKVLTLIEEEADMASHDSFLVCMSEALRFYSIYFDSLEESFGRVSNERLLLERAAARRLINLLACDPFDGHPLPVSHDEEDKPSSSSSSSSSWWCEKRESSAQWASRLSRSGFCATPFADDTVDDVRALLKRYKEGWGLHTSDNSLFLTWKDQNVVFASAWKPS